MTIYVQERRTRNTIYEPTAKMLPGRARQWAEANLQDGVDIQTTDPVIVRTAQLMRAKGELEFSVRIVVNAPEEFGGTTKEVFIDGQGQIVDENGHRDHLPKWFSGTHTGLMMSLFKYSKNS